VLFVLGLPWFVDTLFAPFVEHLRESETPRPAIVLLILAIFAVFPVFFFTPSPGVWLAAWLFPLGTAVAIVFAGNLVKFAVPFVLGRHVLAERVGRWARHSPRFDAAVQVIESEGAFKTVTLLRLAVSDNVVNYLCSAMHPDMMPFGKYLVYSVPPSVPFVVLGVLGARQLDNLTDLLQGDSGMTREDAVELAISVSAGLALAVWAAWYGRRKYRAVLARIRAQKEAGGGGGGRGGGGAAGRRSVQPSLSKSPGPARAPGPGGHTAARDDTAGDGTLRTVPLLTPSVGCSEAPPAAPSP